MQRHVLYLSDALDIDARAPVHSYAFSLFLSMLEIIFCPFQSVQSVQFKFKLN